MREKKSGMMNDNQHDIESGKISNLIFDFDGTLANTSRLIVATMQKSVKDFGLPYRTDEQIKATIGVRLEEIPSILWPEIKGIGESFADVYRNNFKELKDQFPVTLYPGVKQTLQELKEKGYQMAIATSRSHRSVVDLATKLGIMEYFVYILGGDDVLEGKPNPESIFKILSGMGWKAGETIMIGDMSVDILMGKNAGTITCGVTYGNGKLPELEESGADYIISEFPEISNVLKC